MIKVENLTKVYHGRKVVENLSFEIKCGEVFALLGSNGAGKSTTIKMMLGLIRKDGGTIELADCNFGYSPETPYFPPFLTGREVLEYYGELQKIPRSELKDICHALLEKVGLEDNETKVKHYSKGMQQRLALAQALLGNPECLILDEPCAGLDAMGRIEMLEIIRSLKEEGKTILMNSHILSDIEKVCDGGVIIRKGKQVRTFTKNDLSEETLEEMFVTAVDEKKMGGEEA